MRWTRRGLAAAGASAFEWLSGGGSGGPVGVALRIRSLGRLAYRGQPSRGVSGRAEEADRTYAPILGRNGPSLDSVRVVSVETRVLCLASATAPRALETFALETSGPGCRGVPQAAAWAFG